MNHSCVVVNLDEIGGSPARQLLFWHRNVNSYSTWKKTGNRLAEYMIGFESLCFFDRLREIDLVVVADLESALWTKVSIAGHENKVEKPRHEKEKAENKSDDEAAS